LHLRDAAKLLRFPPDVLEKWEEAVESVFREGKTRDLELTMYAGDQKVHYLTKIVPEQDENGNVHSLLSFSRDITEQIRMRESLRRSEEQLTRAQRLESVGRLAGGVAHDFNNILTAITGYVSLAQAPGLPPDKLATYLRTIQDASRRAARLTHQLLLFSRKAPSEIQDVDLNTIVTEMTKMLARIVGENITIETGLEPTLPTIRADTGKIEQVVMNLVVNSRDAMPDGGSIVIQTRRSNTAGGRETETDRVQLVIQDTGSGMDEATKAQIFEPFFTTKGHEKGTGLGLSVVYGIAEEFNADITVESEPGKGTVFQIEFPSEKPLSGGQTGEYHANAIATQVGTGTTVLIIEDDESIGRLIEDSLTAVGMEVVLVGTIVHAESIIRSGRSFDVVLTDVVLPDGSGVEVPERLAAQVPFVFTSGYIEDREDLTRVRERGYAFLQKPFSIEELVSTIRSAAGVEAPG